MEVGSRGRWFGEGFDGIPREQPHRLGTSGMGDTCAKATCLSMDFV